MMVVKINVWLTGRQHSMKMMSDEGVVQSCDNMQDFSISLAFQT